MATVRSPDSADEVRHAHPDASLVVEILDVTDAEVGQAVIDRHRPDVIVNNAGDALLGALVDCEDDAIREQLEVMLVGPNRLARFAAEHRRARGSGRIVNVSPTLASAPVPFTGCSVVHAQIPISDLRSMIYAYPTFHCGIEDALRGLS